MPFGLRTSERQALRNRCLKGLRDGMQDETKRGKRPESAGSDNVSPPEQSRKRGKVRFLPFRHAGRRRRAFMECMTPPLRIAPAIISLYEMGEAPMGRIIIHPHALSHGLSEEQIRYAWISFVRKQRRSAPNEDHVAAIGCDPGGVAIQMVGVVIAGGIMIYHAMTPPTRKLMAELGPQRRRRR